MTDKRPSTEPAPAPPLSFVMALGIDPGFALTGFGGVALCTWPDGSTTYDSQGVELVVTEPNKEKRFESMRVALDDVRRIQVYYDATVRLIEILRPRVIGVETYTIYDSKEYTNLRKAGADVFEALGVTPKVAADTTLPELPPAEDARAEPFRKELVKLAKAVDKFREVPGRGQAAKTYGVYCAVLSAARQHKIPIYPFAPIDLKKRACGRPKATKDEVAGGLVRTIRGLQNAVTTKIRATTRHEHAYDASGHGLLALEYYMAWQREGFQ